MIMPLSCLLALQTARAFTRQKNIILKFRSISNQKPWVAAALHVPKEVNEEVQNINSDDLDGQSSSTSSGSDSADASGGRFGRLLESVGLGGELTHAKDLPARRTVTPNDVFCNRELKMSHIRAIGFDMDYTLAQYQQPAFDKLAFDGAKEKLVKKLGYPEDVLNFEYDHEVWNK